MINNKYTLIVGILLLSGCASVVNETTQPIRVDTKTQDGQLVEGANCKLSNDYGVISIQSGDTAQVHRSNENLSITCKHPDNDDANASAISRANAGLFGNIILGGGIGAIVDHSRGTAYTYPTWVQLIFGQTLEFDRAKQKSDQPTPATATGADEKESDKD